MGTPKLLLPWGGRTVLEQVVENVLLAGPDEVIVVLGHRAEELKPLLKREVRVVVNPDHRRGMSSSLVCGVQAARTGAVMVVLGDQPQIGPEVIGKVLKAFRESDKGIVVPCFDGKRGHPVIFDLKYREELLRLKGDVGAREVVRAHPQDVLEVPVDSPSILRDIDTQEDYEELRHGPA